MHWIAPSEKDDANGNLENRLWESADQFRANSGLTSQEYSAPVLGLIFLRFAEVRSMFAVAVSPCTYPVRDHARSLSVSAHNPRSQTCPQPCFIQGNSR